MEQSRVFRVIEKDDVRIRDETRYSIWPFDEDLPNFYFNYGEVWEDTDFRGTEAECAEEIRSRLKNRADERGEDIDSYVYEEEVSPYEVHLLIRWGLWPREEAGFAYLLSESPQSPSTGL